MTLRQFREAARMTQEEVAARLGTVRTAVTNWERGRNGPNKRLLPRMAALYGCSVEDLLSAEEERRGTAGRCDAPDVEKAVGT